jgi:lipid A 4'-phosphatase
MHPALSPPILIVLAALTAAMAVFAAFPQLDLAIAGSFYALEGGSFDARFDRLLMMLRDIGYYLPIGVLALSLVLWLPGLRKSGRDTVPTGRRVLFLALSLMLGPGLLVNGVLKEVSHRPRPAQVVEFGGADAFRPWYQFDGACGHNCSFVSGETAGATWLLAPASLLPPPWRAVAMAGAALLALAVGLLRLAFGGHFASDAIGAALVTLATIWAIGLALRQRQNAAELCGLGGKLTKR